jgi:hypothetical protein
MTQPFLFALFVKRRIKSVEILAVQMILRNAEGIGETINMKYFLR